MFPPARNLGAEQGRVVIHHPGRGCSGPSACIWQKASTTVGRYRRCGGTLGNSEHLPWAERWHRPSQLNPAAAPHTPRHRTPPPACLPFAPAGAPTEGKRAGAPMLGPEVQAHKYPVPLSQPWRRGSSAPWRHPARWTVPCSAQTALPKPCVTPLMYRSRCWCWSWRYMRTSTPPLAPMYQVPTRPSPPLLKRLPPPPVPSSSRKKKKKKEASPLMNQEYTKPPPLHSHSLALPLDLSTPTTLYTTEKTNSIILSLSLSYTTRDIYIYIYTTPSVGQEIPTTLASCLLQLTA